MELMEQFVKNLSSPSLHPSLQHSENVQKGTPFLNALQIIGQTIF
jgi:hypothetical protein